MKKQICILFLFTKLIAVSQDLSTIKIRNQIWMQKNYENDTFRNGERIKEIKNKEEWYRAGYREEPAWCYYNFDSKYAKLGKLYNYYAISDSKNIAIPGWRVPTFEDFYTLVTSIDPLCTKEYFQKNGSLAGGSLKIKDNINWLDNNCPQINSQFNAIPAGGYSPSLNYPEYDWIKLGEKAMFWSLTKWENLYEFLDSSNLSTFKKRLEIGKFKDKAIVLRLHNDNCVIDADDDPKLYGYYLRLLKEN